MGIRRRARNTTENLTVVTWMVMPFAILFFLFTVLPIVSSVYLSFTNYDMINTPKFVGIGNFTRMFLYDDVFKIALKNTLLFALITGPISYFLCFLVAWLINEFPPAARSVISFVFYSPALAGNAFFIWQFIFSGDRYGLVNSFLLKFGLSPEPLQWFRMPETALPIVMLVQLWLSLGVSFLANIAGLQNVNAELYEAAAIDGVNSRWQEVWYITLPSMKSILLFSAVMQIQSAFSVSTVATALTGFPSTNYITHTIITHMMDYGTVRFEMGYAAAIATFLFVLMAVSRVVIVKLIDTLGR